MHIAYLEGSAIYNMLFSTMLLLADLGFIAWNYPKIHTLGSNIWNVRFSLVKVLRFGSSSTFLIQSLIMYYFTAKTLYFSSEAFQIKILWFGGKFIALIVRWVREILECYFCTSGKVNMILQQLPETLMLHWKMVP